MQNVSRRVYRQIKPLPPASDRTHFLIYKHHTIPSWVQLPAHLPRCLASTRYFFNYSLQASSGWFTPTLSLDPSCYAPITFSSLNVSSHDLFAQFMTQTLPRSVPRDEAPVTITTKKALNVLCQRSSYCKLCDPSMPILLYCRGSTPWTEPASLFFARSPLSFCTISYFFLLIQNENFTAKTATANRHA